jgi:PIN domain nuclease of toxin-antitoxin system
MNILLDTHMLLWAAKGTLPERARTMATDPGNELFFSVASIWEIVIKAGLGRPDFTVDGGVLRRELLEHRYRELPVLGQHVLMLQSIPPLHRDPFDRLLVAQANSEGLLLVTSDRILQNYPGSILFIPARQSM